MCDTKLPKIKIVGIGGAGCNIINRLLKREIKGIEYYIADSDEEVLKSSSCSNKIETLSVFDDGITWLKTIQQQFQETIQDADMVVMISGLGGYVGSTFTPLLAEVAKSIGIMTIAVVATPFEFEGKTRMTQCVKSLERLKTLTDTVIVVPNHRVKKIVPKTTTMRTALSVIDTVIFEAVNSIASSICEPSLINVEYEDVAQILKGGGLAYLGVGVGEGENSIQDALKRAIYNPISSTKINTAKRILLSVTGGTKLDLQNATTIADAVRNAVDADTNILFSMKIEESWTNKIRIAIIGLSDEKTIVDEPKDEVQMDSGEKKFNAELSSVLAKAEELAAQFNTTYIASEHLVYAMLLVDCKAGEILRACGCGQELYEKFFVMSLNFDVAIKGYTPRTKMILQHAEEDAILKNSFGAWAGTEHVLYDAIGYDTLACKILRAVGVNMQLLIDMLKDAIKS